MPHAYVERFDVMNRRGNILDLTWEVNEARVRLHASIVDDSMRTSASAIPSRFPALPSLQRLGGHSTRARVAAGPSL
jgi:hypothetical protein